MKNIHESPDWANGLAWKERILFLNDACIVINKLSGESSESICPPGESRLAEKFLLPVHRLDMPVTGCLLLARNSKAAALLSAAFANQDGRVEKLYWAIIEKPPLDCVLPPSGELVHWLKENRKTNKSFAYEVGDDNKIGDDYEVGDDNEVGEAFPKGQRLQPKKAILRYRLTGEGEHYLFMEIDLVTGRHHQIRSQLAAIGLHIKGDLKYGSRRSEKAGGIRLHAHSLAFPNPLAPEETIRVKAPPPVMDSLWTAFTDSLGHQP